MSNLEKPTIRKNDKFSLLKEFELTVPKHKGLDDFKKKYKKDFYYFNDKFTDKNFPKNNLKVGKTYKVKIWNIKDKASSEDILDLLKANNCILASAQGLALLWQEKRNSLPKGKWYISIDEKENLPVAGGYTLVPRILCFSDGDFWFNLGSFEVVWGGDYCVIGFCEI